MDPALCEMLEGEPEEELEVIIRLRRPGVAPPRVRLVAQFGEIATCRLQRSNIRAVRQDEEVLSLKASRKIVADNEILSSLPERMVEDEILSTDVRRPASLQETGRGVVLGVADWGCDFAYPSFRNADGSTRLLALWDQAAPYHPEFPNRYGYGRIYTAQEINRALGSPAPYAALSYYSADSDIEGDGSHATHVMDIAAGNGRNGGPVGIAPEAELVFVHLAARGTEGLANLGDSVRLLEAVDFIFQTAGSRPWVINLSVGRHGGPHDGCTLVEQGFDALLAAVQGGAISQSAGNYFNQRVHSSGRLRAGESTTLTIEVDEADKTPNEIEVWYSGQDVFVVEVRAPDGTRFRPVALGEQASLKIEGREVGRVYHRAHDPNNCDHHIDIFLYPGGPGGAWEIKLTGERIGNGAFHAWIERDAGCWRCQTHFLQEESDSSTTTGTICNGFLTIAVGAYNPHSSQHEIAVFSSAGTTRDGRQKPDILAPGMNILAARSAPREKGEETPLLTEKSGTSMASPCVAGTLALMFEAAGRPLRIEETRELLLTSTRATALPEHEIIRAGRGYLDIEKAVKAASKFGGKDRCFASETILEERSELTVSSYPHSELDERDTFSIPAEIVLANIHETKSEGETTMCNCKEKADQQVEEADVSEIWESENDEEHEYDVFPEFEKNFGAELVELADEAISAGKGFRSPGALIDQILSEAGITETLNPLGVGSFPSAAEIFDVFASGRSPALRRHFEQFFEVVALPGSIIEEDLHQGDLQIRRALGEGNLAHLSVIASPELWGYEELLSKGLIPEIIGPGKYAQVVETGARPHTLSDAFARRVADPLGRLPYDQLVLRPREQVRQRVTESIPLEEAVPATFSVGSLVPARRFVDMPLTYEDFITNATGSGIVIRRTRCDTMGHVASMLRGKKIGTSAGHDVVISHADLIRSMSAVPMLWQVGSGDRLQAALDLVIFHPADPADLTRLPTGSTRFPLAIIVHGNHGVCTTTSSGALDPPITPSGGGPSIRFSHSATFGPEVPNHMGYSAITPPMAPAWLNPLGINTGPALVPYLQEELARHGIISVSVSTNAANFFDLHLETRADLILKAVAEMGLFDSDRGSPFFKRINFKKVAFIGHSRGGDAVVRAALKRRSLKVKALVQIAPTDITGLTAGPAPAGGARIDFVTSPTRVSSDLDAFHLIVYGSRDGDVSGLGDVRAEVSVHPFRHYDRSSAQRAFFFWHGATHNRFNRFWEDTQEGPLVDLANPAGLLDRIDQEARTRELVGGCLRFALNAEMGERDRLNGRVLSTIAPTRPMAAMWKLGRALKTIDNFDDPRSDRNTLGGRNLPPASGLVDEIRLANENDPGAGVTTFQFMHVDRVLRAVFITTPVPGVGQAPGGAPLPPGTVLPMPITPGPTSSGRWRAEIPSLDQNFSSFTLLTLRVTKKWNPNLIIAANRPRVNVRLVDTGRHTHEQLAAGRISALPAVRVVSTSLPPPPGSPPGTTVFIPPGFPFFDLTKYHFETWEVELSSFASAGVNLHRVAAVELDMTGHAGESIYVDTVSLVRL